MASEWAREKVEQIVKLAGCIHADDCGEPYGEGPCTCWVEEVWQEIAAALDEARAEGAMLADQELYRRGFVAGQERERWECWEVARTTLLDFPDARWLSDVLALMQKRLAARGPMRGPEEE